MRLSALLSQRAQILMRIQSRVVPIIPCKLNRVQAYGIYFDRANRVFDIALLDSFFSRPLVNAIRARAFLAQHLDVVDGLVTIRPGDAERSRIHLLDRLRRWIVRIYLLRSRHRRPLWFNMYFMDLTLSTQVQNYYRPLSKPEQYSTERQPVRQVPCRLSKLETRYRSK